jgi:hypothetical protein
MLTPLRQGPAVQLSRDTLLSEHGYYVAVYLETHSLFTFRYLSKPFTPINISGLRLL